MIKKSFSFKNMASQQGAAAVSLPALSDRTLSLPMDGSFAGTHSRASNAWNPETGQVAPHNLALYSEDMSPINWVVGAGVTKTDSHNIAFAPAVNILGITNSIAISSGTANQTFIVTVKVSTLSGTKAFRIKNTHAAVLDNYSADLTATMTPQIFSFSVTNGSSVGNGNQTFGIINDVANTVGSIYIHYIQLNQYSLTSYVPTTTAAVYSPRYVSGKTGQAMLIEEASANYFVNSQGTAAVTQNIAVTTAGSGKWTCSVFGAGTVTSSAGTATATGYGAATVGAPNTITVTGNGTVTYTVTGATAATIVNVEALPYATSPIVSGASVPVTRAADVVTHLTGANGTFSSGDLVTNGDFSSATGWSVPAGSAIGSNVLTATASTGYLYRASSGPLTAGKTYFYSYDIVSISGGSVRAYVNSTPQFGTAETTVGTKTGYVVALNTNTEIGLNLTGVTGVIDNFSIKECNPALTAAQGTINLWFYNDLAKQSSSTIMNFIEHGTTAANNLMRVRKSAANQYGFHVSDAAGTLCGADVAQTLTAGWHMMTLTWGAAGTFGYIDAVQVVADTTGIVVPAALASTFSIGQNISNLLQADTSVDNINAWSVSLTQAQITQAFRSGR